MELLNPWFLAGGLALGLPLWLHLLQRRNPVRQMFSSLMFFEKRTHSTVRERRLQYLLLLVLRLLMLLFLVLAFAKPIWERAAGAFGSGLPNLHIVVLDTSLSMQYGERWGRAQEEASDIITSMSESDRAQIIANGPSIQVLSDATNDKSMLTRILGSSSPGDSHNNFGDVIKVARNLVPAGGTPVKLHVISDFQNTAMPTRFQDLVLPPATTLEFHDVAAEESENWAIESIKGSIRLFGAEHPRIEVTVASHATESAEKKVSLLLDGRLVDSQSQQIEAGKRGTFRFDITDPPRGYSRAVFQLEPGDALPGDDMRRVALDNTEPAPLLFVTADNRQRDLLYYQTALESSSEMHYRLESVSPREAERLDPGSYAMVVLSDVTQLMSNFDSRLRTWVELGGAVLVALGPNSVLARKSLLTSHEVEQPLATERNNALFQVAGEADLSHPVVAAVERFRPVKFYLNARIKPLEGDIVSLRLGNGDPLLLEHQMGKGRVMFFASTFDNIWNDLPLTGVFVPFVAETASYLTGAESGSGEMVLGDMLELDRRRGSGSAVQVLNPSGERVLTLTESTSQETLSLDEIGFFEIRGAKRTELLAVNPDPRESNLVKVDNDTLALWQSTGSEGTTIESSEVEIPPLNIWRVLLLLLFMAMLVESFVGNQHLRYHEGELVP